MTTPQSEAGGGIEKLGPDGTGEEVVAFVRGRSVPCPRCAYELRDLERAQCPECGEPLILRVGTPRMRFGWLVLTMVPGCFSGVMATLLFVPGAIAVLRFGIGGKNGLPIPLPCAEAFGIMSATSVWLMYRERHRIIAMKTARQVKFAAAVWAVHILAFVAVVGAMILWYN